MRDILLQASEAARYILEKTSVRPRIAVILGSGLGGLADEVTDERIEIPYSEIPNFKTPTVAGHCGKMILGKIYDKDVKKLLFEVTYFRKRINLEVYHTLTDGTGALQFLKTLVINYITLKHKEEFMNIVPEIDYDASNFQ